MNENSIKESIIIDSTPSKIWSVLTAPEQILLYTGSNTVTDWTVGSPITWEGEMHGSNYVNKGKVLDHIPYNLLRFTFWTGVGGDPDMPENYSEITYTLDAVDEDSVEFTYSRINIPTEMEKQLFEEKLPTMLAEIKSLSEE